MTTAAEYESSIWQEVRDNPKYGRPDKTLGALVYVTWTEGRSFYGHVWEWHGFSDFWHEHKYSVRRFDGSIEEGIFECDMKRESLTGSVLYAYLKRNCMAGGLDEVMRA